MPGEKINCKWPGCDRMFFSRNLDRHQKYCEFRESAEALAARAALISDPSTYKCIDCIPLMLLINYVDQGTVAFSSNIQNTAHSGNDNVMDAPQLGDDNQQGSPVEESGEEGSIGNDNNDGEQLLHDSIISPD